MWSLHHCLLTLIFLDVAFSYLAFVLVYFSIHSTTGPVIATCNTECSRMGVTICSLGTA